MPLRPGPQCLSNFPASNLKFFFIYDILAVAYSFQYPSASFDPSMYGKDWLLEKFMISLLTFPSKLIWIY